jgi:hypothetical protein
VPVSDFPQDCMSPPQMRRLTLDVATRVARMDRAEPQTRRASRGSSYRPLSESIRQNRAMQKPLPMAAVAARYDISGSFLLRRRRSKSRSANLQPGLRQRNARSAQGPRLYRGYYYRILTRQGPHAAGGTLNYIVNGNMIGGTLVAYPADCGNSGVMTFLVNHVARFLKRTGDPKQLKSPSA